MRAGIPYEILVQSIFQEIHDQQSAHTIQVEHDITLQGTHTTHQIDVYWEFLLGGIVYRTIVQARDWKNAIKQEDVLAFKEVLNDIPGQPRGIIVTRTGFQRGAKAVAKGHGIKLYLLSQYRSHHIITDVSWAEYRLDAARLLLHFTHFRPEFSLNLSFALPSKPPSTVKRYPPKDFKLFDENGTSMGTVRDIIAEFSDEMRKTGTQAGPFSRDFTKPTFFKYPRQAKGKSYQLNSLKAEMKIVEERWAPALMLPPGIVEYILHDLESEETQKYQRRKLETA
jgi:hypothetical protein